MSGPQASRTRPQGGIWASVWSLSSDELAAYCAILLAAAFIAIGVTYVLLPSQLTDSASTLFKVASSPGLYELLYYELALTGVLGLAVVAPATKLLAGDGNAWTQWASRIAYVGFAVAIVDSLRIAALLPMVGHLYQGCGSCTGSLAVQQTIAKWLYMTLPLDPLAWVEFGGVGLWVLALAVAAIRGPAMPLAWVGVAVSAAYWLVVIGDVSGISQLVTIAAVAGGVILGPIWYAWIGVLLRARKV